MPNCEGVTMPLPIFLLGASVISGLIINEQHKKSLRQQDINRLDYKVNKNIIGRMPSDILPSNKSIKMIPGTIVCCHVYGGFEHTGIVIDDELIIELHGSGLVKAVTPKRFLSNRSGENIFIACNKAGDAYSFTNAIKRAQEEVYKYYEYNLLECNCYAHTWYCIGGAKEKITDFDDFNEKLFTLTQQAIYWDKVELSCVY